MIIPIFRVSSIYDDESDKVTNVFLPSTNLVNIASNINNMQVNPKTIPQSHNSS